MIDTPRTQQDSPSQGTDSYDTRDLLGRLKRIEGQLRGVCRMLDESRPCVEVLQQVAAAESALGRIGYAVFRRHVSHCVQPGLAPSAQPSEDPVGGLLELVARLDDLSQGHKAGAPLTAQYFCVR